MTDTTEATDQDRQTGEHADPPGAADDAERAGFEGEEVEDQPPVEELDPETRARRDAALRLVRKFGDPVLRSRAVPVERFDEALQTEVARMGQLMHDALGV